MLEKHPLKLNLTLSYDDGNYIKSLALPLSAKELLVGGKTFMGPKFENECYIPIFKNNDDTNTKWVFGALFMEKYYMVFDMSTASKGYN